MTEDFFDPLPEPPAPEQFEPPVWFRPPPDELAALVPVRQLLARTDRGVVVLLSHIDAFRQGCSFRIRISAHRPEGMDDSEWHEIHETAMGGARFHPRRLGVGGADGMLRFGVQFRDGHKATTMGAPRPHHWRDQEPDGPLLTQHGGGGSGSDRFATSSSSLWLWPLPPAEPFDLVVAWPALGVGLTRVELPGADIVEAASHVGPVWPDTTG